MNAFLKNVLILTLVLLAGFFTSCGDDDGGDDGLLLSKRKNIVSLEIEGGCLGGNITGTVNDNFTITVTVPFGTDVTELAPDIEISEEATISPESGSVQDFTTPVTYTVTAEDQSTQEWIVIVTQAVEGSEPVLTLSDPVWSFTTLADNLPSWLTGSNSEDGIAYGNDHVYVVNNHDNIKILNPLDGTSLGDLDNNGVDGGSLKLSDVETSEDGSILASNVVDHNGTGTATFKVYKWDNETSTPIVFISYEVSDAVRLGDNLSVIGDVSGDAVIYTAYGRNFSLGVRGTDVYRWEVTGGVLDETPTIITGQGFGISGFGSRAHATALNVDDDVVWVNGNDIDVATISLADGSIQQQLPNSSRDLVDFFYNNFVLFELCDKTIMASVFPRSANESRLLVIDVTNGLNGVTAEEVIYSEDFVQGTATENADASGNVTYNKVSESEAEIYILVTNQAFAKFNLTLEVASN